MRQPDTPWLHSALACSAHLHDVWMEQVAVVDEFPLHVFGDLAAALHELDGNLQFQGLQFEIDEPFSLNSEQISEQIRSKGKHAWHGSKAA